jgi:type III restriction enzyme
MLPLRDYQEQSLEALSRYFRATLVDGANVAFYRQTERRYRPVPTLTGLPYVCLRVPTGGGKTLMACHALAIATREYQQAERSVCLWLVPSNAIRQQTLAALRDRGNPYRQAIDSYFGGQVSVMDLAEALYATKGTLSGDTCVIVATLAALRVEDTDGRKVYETSGALMDHFSGLCDEAETLLERDANGIIPYSLCNVLRLHRPIIVIDEAHNARTPLSFDTLRRFAPSCIIEFTATPQTKDEPDRGQLASNILHHVSAAQLKAAEMIKLPVRVATETEWKVALGRAVQLQRDLESKAQAEERETGEYLRPIVLVQAQSRSATRETLTPDVLQQSLREDFQIPEDQIAIATGQTRGIEDVDLFARDCQIRFIITVAALREGWDCSFAYVLCSVSEVATARSVEQVLGRILRLPRAKRKCHVELNRAYAVVVSQRFLATAQALRDALIENGFQRMEAELAVESESQATFWESGTLFYEAREVFAEAPDLSRLSPELAGRVEFDGTTGECKVRGELSDAHRVELAGCFRLPESRQRVERLYRTLRGKATTADDPDSLGRVMRVPGLAIRVDGEWTLFDEDHFLDTNWRLAEYDASLSAVEFPTEAAVGPVAEIDATDTGQVEVRFVSDVQRQLRLVGVEPGWSLAGLTNWLDRRIGHPDVTRTQATLFIQRSLEGLIESRGTTVESLAAQKFRLATAVAAKIDKHRTTEKSTAFQRRLFGANAAELEVGPEICFELTFDRYAAHSYHENMRFDLHLFPTVGEMNGEEEECAVFIDQQLGGVKHWVRNIERTSGSFWLQTSTDKFYPDFVVELLDGRILVVEYKGKDRWSTDDSVEKRKVGALWADRSRRRCVFVMPCGPDFGAIRQVVGG